MKIARLFLAIGTCLVVAATVYHQHHHVPLISRDAGEMVFPEVGESGRPRAEADLDNDWFMTQRTYPGTELPRNVVQKMKRSMTKFAASMPMRSVAAASGWELAGPSNIGGRINCLAIHPTDPSTIYAGAASGGIWKTTDLGYTWHNVFNESFSIGAITLDPSDPNTIYVGTGENVPGGVATYPGNGIWRSSDAGASWTNIGLSQIGYTGRIAVNPGNPSEIFVAAIGLYRSKTTERGIYKTTNTGSTWTKVLYLNDTTGAVDVIYDPQDTSHLFAAMWTRYRTPHVSYISGISSGLYTSTNGGSTWSLVTNGFPNNSSNLGRISFAFAPSNLSMMYALTAGGVGWDGIFRSSDRGGTWTRTFSGSSFGEGQVWYNNVLTVDPDNAAHLWAGMTNLYTSADFGGTFNYASFSGSSHPDYHAIEYAPSDHNIMVMGDDGGIFISTDAGSSWRKSVNLPITQFYAGSVSVTNPGRFIGGTQDNNTLQVTNGLVAGWIPVYGGDGFYCLFDPVDSNNVYAEYQNGGLGYSTDGGATFTYNATSGIVGGERHNWSQPIAMDLQNPQTLYTGTQRLYRTTDGMHSWTPISGDLTFGDGGRVGTISTITVAPSDPNVLYVGTDDGRVWRSVDHGGTWDEIGSSLPVRWVTRVTADPTTSSTVYVTLSGFYENDFGSHVYRSTDYGATWSNIGASLPDIPVNDIIVDPGNSSTLYIATDLNVCYSTDLGAHWAILGTDLPEVPVHDLEIHAYPSSKTILTAFTHGRSAFTYDLSLIARQSIAIAVNPRWNLVSNPFANINDSVSTLFPNAVGPTAFAYSASGYAEAGRIAQGKGYWLKFPSQSGLTDTIAGYLSDTVSTPVEAGWNLVGAPASDMPASAIQLTGASLQSSFYGYQSGYIVADTLKAGHAYWIKVDQTGSISYVVSANRPKSVPTVHHSPAVELRIADAMGNSQPLYLGAAGSSSVEAPPAPPAGSFDIRFATGQLLEGPAAVGRRVAIAVRGAEYPVTIHWKALSSSEFVLTIGSHSYPMESEGEAVLHSANETAFVSSGIASELPATYSLSQNYPNPFNPSTSIRYALPRDGRATLDIYNTAGERVARLVDGMQTAGYHTVQFNAGDRASGVYFYTLKAGEFSETRKLVLMK